MASSVVLGTQALWGLLLAVLLSLSVWGASLPRRDASLIDRFWPLLIVAPGVVYAMQAASLTGRAGVMLVLALLWALRLAGYLTWRNWGRGEDHRYAAMRRQHGAAFASRSLWAVFGLQALLAWIVGAPLLAAAGSDAPWRALDTAGAALALFGIVYEAVADAQLATFKRNPDHRGQVMDRGLWAWSRHPNYFGEACVWWGLGLMAWSAGAAWALVSPVLMTGLLLKVSGVSLLERDIAERRPGYRDYMRRTRAFIPGPPRSGIR